MTSMVETPVEELNPPKKDIEILRVLAEKVRGHVKWYSVARRYGFISRNDDGGDLFVHRSVISSYSRRFPSLRSGEEVEFNVVETNHGLEATYVTGPGGQPVKGIRPMYRRYRTTSEPNGAPDTPHEPAVTPESEHIRPRQTGRRPRGPRQPSNRVRSAGANESQRTEDGEHPDDAELQGNGSAPHEEHEQPAVDGQSPNHTVPRQRRRPQRRTPRHRSAPTADRTVPIDGEVNGLEQGPRTPVTRYDGRGLPRPFRRPFRQRVGFRYANGYSYGPNYAVQSGGPPPYQNRFRPMGGYRNGFEQYPRRRGFGGGYPRGPRRRPPASGDYQVRNENGQIKVNDEEQPRESTISSADEVAQHTSDVSKDTVPVDQAEPEVAAESEVVPDTTTVPQEAEDTQPTPDTDHPDSEAVPKVELTAVPTVDEVTKAVQEVALDEGQPVVTTSVESNDTPVEQEAQ